MKSWAIAMGLGAAAGAVAIMMTPRQSTARKVVNKAACKVEDAVARASDKMTQQMGM